MNFLIKYFSISIIYINFVLLIYLKDKNMERVSQFINGNEVTVPLSSVNNCELYFDVSGEKIKVYRKTKKGNILVKILNNYGELYEVKGINLEPRTPNFIVLNP